MKSSVYPNHDAGDFSDYGFDPQADFVQFLEEAKQHKTHEICHVAVSNKKQIGNISLVGEEKKGKKKSWKRYFLSWWKADKKDKKKKESEKVSHGLYNGKKCNFSGPIYNSGYVMEKRHLCSTSGPLTTAKRVENEIPYVPLGQHCISPSDAYGPLYLVT